MCVSVYALVLSHEQECLHTLPSDTWWRQNCQTNEKLHPILIRIPVTPLKKKTPWAENTSVSWQLLHATDWFACFSLIFLFGFVCAVLFSSAACQPGIRIAYCYILSTKVSAWLSRDTSFFFARLCFSPPKKLIVTIDFHVTFYVISYHSFNFFIFSNLTHLPPHQLFSVQKSFMEDFRWRIQFFTNALLTWIFHRGSS